MYSLRCSESDLVNLRLKGGKIFIGVENVKTLRFKGFLHGKQKNSQKTDNCLLVKVIDSHLGIMICTSFL